MTVTAGRTKPNGVARLVDWFLTRCKIAISVVDAYVDKPCLARVDKEEGEQVKDPDSSSANPHV